MATLPLDGVKTFYPVKPDPKSNVLVWPQDSREWKTLQKSASAWRHEYVSLKFRINDENYPTFLSFLVANQGKIVTLYFPGMQPFIRSTESNDVYLKTFSRPSLVLPLQWETTVLFLNSVITA